MEKITVEQLYKTSTYRQPGSNATAATNMADFAFSFEDLLRRVGARVNHAFSAADKSSSIITSSNDVRRDPAPRVEERRNEPTEDRARPSDDNFGDSDAPTPVGNNADRTDTSNQAQSSDTGAADRTSRSGDGDDDRGHQANNNTDTASSESTGDDGQNSNENAGDTTATNDTSADGSNTDGQAAATTASENAPQNAAAAGQAAALYAAGVVGNAASENAKSGNAQHGQQGQVATKAAQGVTAQIAAGAAGAAAKGQQSNRANNHQSTANKQIDQNQAAAAKAGEIQQQTKPDTLQDQAQRLAGMLNKHTRAEVKVSINSEQNQLTSKPTATLASGSIITKDGTSNNAGGDRQQNGQRPGANTGQMTQQMQLAANQQQAQVTQQQQATAQGGPQGGTTQIGGTQGGIQSTGGAAHNAGGADAMNNTQSNAGTQQTQQTQQARDTQPQQQTQQAQRSNMAGTSVADQISVKITKALQAGTDRISIQLRPAELGRVDVKMEMTHDGRIMTVVTAEKQDTLDLLRRDSSELQRALADAGLNSGDMEFNLKGQEQQNAKGEDGNDSAKPNGDADAEEQLAQNDDGVMNAWESGIFMNGRIDMRA